MSEKTQKFILSTLGVLAMSILVGYLVFAWTEPSQNPPQGNVEAPLNTSINAQAKQGALVIGTNSSLSTGLIVQYGNVGIGTTEVTAKLTIQNLDSTQAALLIKQNQSGSLFQKTIGGGSYYDVSHSIQQTSDGGYIITGETLSFGAGSYDVFVIKLDSSGNLSWAKTIGGTKEDDGYSIQQTSDGGYVITGETFSFGAGERDVFVIKLDSSGNLSWAKTIGGASSDSSFSIQQTSDGGYIITGYTNSFNSFGVGTPDVFVIKLDSSGNIPGCSSATSVNPTVSSQNPTVRSYSPTVSSQNPTVRSYSPTVSSQNPSIASQCLITSNTSDFSSLIFSPQGNLGIGTMNPTQKLDVAGYIKGTGLCIGNDCRTSWSSTYQPTYQTFSGGSSVSCPSGWIMTGGGCWCVDNTNDRDSSGYGGRPKDNGWECMNTTGAGCSGGLTAYVRCVKY